jgi:hypothetical protein
MCRFFPACPESDRKVELATQLIGALGQWQLGVIFVGTKFVNVCGSRKAGRRKKFSA